MADQHLVPTIKKKLQTKYGNNREINQDEFISVLTSITKKIT